ncbi:MAG TPA: ABC transporter substrate-binding protein [Nitrososphaerales archaeon]|nr:ABC transporter substrate-binding protein [Nitrososphaerales archaeon]
MKKRGASTSVVIGSLIVGLLIGAGVVYVAAPSLGLGSTTTIQGAGGRTITTTVTTSAAQAAGLCNGQTITIGALNDLSSDLSTQGKGDLAAEQIAITEVNAYVKSNGCSLTFALNNQDTKLDGALVLSELTAMYSSGVRVVVGPLWSGGARAGLAYANSNHILMISPSSTSPALHVTDTINNYLFRTAPNDAAQGQGIARELLSQGTKAVIVVNRDDTYGGGLANATVSFLKQDGMAAANIAGPFKYDPTTTDFSALISQMTSAYNTLNTGANAGHVRVVAVSFQELGTLLKQASTQSATIYNDVPWYGSDGEAQNSLLSNSTVGQYTSHVELPSTLFNVVNNSRTFAFFAKYAGTSQLAAITGGGVFYTLEGYDDLWLAALSILTAGANDGTAIHAAFPTVANSFYGLTGWEGLSGNDRIPGSYQIWKVVSSGSTFAWVLAGTWDYSTDTVTWTSPP